MKTYFIIFIALIGILFLPNFVYSSNNGDTITTSVKSFGNSLTIKPILRTYSIKFSTYTNHLDLSDEQTRIFLDSMVNVLKANSNIVIEVGIHMSLKYSNESSKSLDFMHEEIIEYFTSKGLIIKQFVGKNYYDTEPILSLPKNENEYENFWKSELINSRVEFKII
jgi:hypothetical protein